MSEQPEPITAPLRRLPHTFGWTFLAAFTALIAIGAIHYYSAYRSERIGRETAEQASVELVRQAMVADVAAVVTDLMVLARHIEQMTLAQDTTQASRGLESVFIIFAEQKRLYDQIRFINASGKETLRVNLVGDRAQSVHSSELQDKSDRYYFAESSALSQGDIYISPLDLNIEQGRIERPFKPVMRFATPIFEAGGARAGIVVLNYLGQRLLDAVQRASGPIGDHLHLVEPRGYWLYGPEPNNAWGFMFGSNRTFARKFPEEWRRIGQRRRGQLLTANGLFTFATVSPHPVAHAAVRSARTDLATPTDTRGSPYAWKIIARLPFQDLVPSPTRFLADHMALYGAMLALLALGSYLLARARIHHHIAELQSDYERRFRRTLEDIQLVAVALDKAGRITFCNRFFLALTHWNRSEVVGNPWLDLFTPEHDRARMQTLIATLDAPERFPSRYTCEVLTHSGELRLLAWHNSLNTDAEGRPIGVTAIGEDITEQRRNETAVRKLNQAVEQSPSILIITDRSGLIEYVNPKFTEVTGYSLEEVIGQNPRVLKSGETAAGEYAELWQTVSAGGEWRGEFHNRRKNGELYWESASISALRDAEGRITHYLAVKEDITERKRQEQEEESRNRELARAQALAEVGRMATMIAHDLRNPLSSVKIALQVLSKQDTPDGESRELRSIAREQVAYMEAILSDMLAYARPRTPTLEWLHADRLLQNVVGLTQKRLDEQAVTLVTEYQSGLPTFPGDPNQLRQVFSNLFINAIQATEDLPPAERRVSIGTGLELAPEGTRIRIEICDNGRGIDAQPTSRLFEPFFTTRAKGTGLGLAIVRRILDAHDADISLGPNPPKGTCCMVLLPTVPRQTDASLTPETAVDRFVQ